MKTVIVCNTNINELIYLIDCKLGELGTSLMYEKKYGISDCQNIKLLFSELSAYKELLLDILNNRNSGADIIDIINLPMICNMCEYSIEKMIERIKDILMNCVNCKDIEYKLLEVLESSFANEWYTTPEYIECLQSELEDNGWIEPLIDLCQNMNISISAEKLCKAIAIEISATKESCMELSEISVQSAFNNMLISKFNIYKN